MSCENITYSKTMENPTVDRLSAAINFNARTAAN